LTWGHLSDRLVILTFPVCESKNGEKKGGGGGCNGGNRFRVERLSPASSIWGEGSFVAYTTVVKARAGLGGPPVGKGNGRGQMVEREGQKTDSEVAWLKNCVES